MTSAAFDVMTTNLTKGRRAQVLPPLQEAMLDGNISTPRREAHFMAQVLHESGRFRYKRELASGWAYEGRRDLGNTQKGDGPRYRGRGWIQVTGRANYAKYGSLIGVDLIKHPELAETDENAARIAVAYWSKQGLNAYADRDDLLTITRRINGGTNGLADRRTCLSIAREALKLKDEDPSELDTHEGLPIFWLETELPFDAFLNEGTSWAPLRPFANFLKLTIVEAEGDDATLRKVGDGTDKKVALEVIGNSGFSPVKQLAQLMGKTATYDGPNRRIVVA